MENLLLKYRIPGAAISLIQLQEEEKETVIYEAAYGDFGNDTDVMNPEKTLFHLSSLSRSFTALGVLKLIDLGLLSSIDATANEYLKRWKIEDATIEEASPVSTTAATSPFSTLSSLLAAAAAAAPRAASASSSEVGIFVNGSAVTVKQLLQHTSGIARVIYRGYSDFSTAPHDIVESITRSGVHLHRLSGEFTLSHANYAILQLLIEDVTGLPFEVYMHQHIFGPLNMTRTRYNITDVDVGTGGSGIDMRHVSYGFETYGRSVPRFYFVERGDVGLYSTVNDVTKFLMYCLRNDTTSEDEQRQQEGIEEVLSASSKRLFLDSLTEIIPGAGEYAGLGIFATMEGGNVLSYHNYGSSIGWQSYLSFAPDAKLAIAVLTNSDNGFRLLSAVSCDWANLVVRDSNYCVSVSYWYLYLVVGLMIGFCALLWAAIGICLVAGNCTCSFPFSSFKLLDRSSSKATSGAEKLVTCCNLALRVSVAVGSIGGYVAWHLLLNTDLLYRLQYGTPYFTYQLMLPYPFQWFTLVIGFVLTTTLCASLFIYTKKSSSTSPQRQQYTSIDHQEE